MLTRSHSSKRSSPNIAEEPRYKKQKTSCPIIFRTFYDDRLNCKQGTKRLTVVCYHYNKITKECRYAAALFKEDKANEIDEHFGTKKNLKKQLRHTALKRLSKKPMIIPDVEDNGKLDDFHKQIRSFVRIFGAYKKPSRLCDPTKCI